MPAKRKKRMRLPNGFGSIKYLGKGRRNPYAVYPPVERWTASGPVTPPALGYRETWQDAYELLTAYNLEKQGKIKVNRNVFIDRTPTFAEVYEGFYQEKFFNSEKQFSKASMNSTRAAFKNCSSIHNRQIGSLKYNDLQTVVNSCELKHSSVELIINLMHQLYKYASKYEIVDKDYSAYLYMPKEEDDESGVPFNDEELEILWNHADNSIISMIVIMCYSGYRIKAYEDIEINLTENFFKGGVKTLSGKDRIVPIHSGILALVKNRYDGTGNLIGCTPNAFRQKMYKALQDLNIKRHTPHDCRHTFSMLCEKYNVNENDRKRLLGHSFGGDITNSKYGHRSLDDLRLEIEKIRLPL